MEKFPELQRILNTYFHQHPDEMGVVRRKILTIHELVSSNFGEAINDLSDDKLRALHAEVGQLLEQYPNRTLLVELLNTDRTIDDSLGYLAELGGIDIYGLFGDIQRHLAHYLNITKGPDQG